MARFCSVCSRPDLKAIHATIGETSIRQTAARFGVPVATLARHYSAHRETPRETAAEKSETGETPAPRVPLRALAQAVSLGW
jgi:hypothetical protein